MLRRGITSVSTPTATAYHERQFQQLHDQRRRPQQRQQYYEHATLKFHQHDEARRERNVQNEFEGEIEDDDDDYDLFSIIVSSDIESDQDILDQSEFTHEFPDEERSRRVKQFSENIAHDMEREDELLGVRHCQRATAATKEMEQMTMTCCKIHLTRRKKTTTKK